MTVAMKVIITNPAMNGRVLVRSTNISYIDTDYTK